MQYSTYMQTRWLLNLNTPQNWVKRAKNKLKGQILIYVCQPSTSHILFSLTASVLTNKHCKCNEACRTIIQQCHKEANLKLPNDEQRNSWFYKNQQTMQYKTRPGKNFLIPFFWRSWTTSWSSPEISVTRTLSVLISDETMEGFASHAGNTRWAYEHR